MIKKVITVVAIPFVVAWYIAGFFCEMVNELLENIYHCVHEILWKDKEQNKLKNPHV